MVIDVNKSQVLTASYGKTMLNERTLFEALLSLKSMYSSNPGHISLNSSPSPWPSMWSGSRGAAGRSVAEQSLRQACSRGRRSGRLYLVRVYRVAAALSQGSSLAGAVTSSDSQSELGRLSPRCLGWLVCGLPEAEPGASRQGPPPLSKNQCCFEASVT